MLPRDQFSAWWNELNAEFPVYRQTDDQMAATARAWYRELQFQSAVVLADASREWRRTKDKRPHLAGILELCGRYHARAGAVEARKRADWLDTNTCPCGCGGPRWARVIPAKDGGDQLFPVADTPDWLAGTLLTRDVIACTARGTDPVPTGHGVHVGSDARGVPIWGTNAE